MKKLFLMGILTLLLASCFIFPENDQASGSFVLEVGLTDIQASKVSLEYTTPAGEERRALVSIGTESLSDRIYLKNGNYILTRCVFMDSQNNIIAAAPLSGTNMASDISDPLPLDFTISKNEMITLTPDCIEYGVDDEPELYGYAAAEINVLNRYDDFAVSINNFTFDLLKEVSNDGSNSFISPVSIMYAFGLLHPATGSKSTDALNDVFYLTDYEQEELYQLYKDFGNYLIHLDEGVELSLAHALWYCQGKTLQNDYVSTLMSYFNAAVEACDFGNADSCADVINQWASDNTNERIDNVITPLEITPDSRAFLANATYFKGLWLSEFSKDDTKKEYFYSDAEDSDSVLCDMMQGGDEEEGIPVKYLQDRTADCMVVSLPFKNNSCYEMVCVMPLSARLETFKETLTADLWETWSSSSVTIDAIVYLPKFTQRFKYDLIPSLQNLGLQEIFSPSADMSNMFTDEEPLFVSSVSHDTFIEVKEEGAEAAAVTVIGCNATSDVSRITILNLDHPFFYAIQDAQTHAIVFIGEMTDPSSEGK